MSSYEELVNDFLEQKCIAVVGVSRTSNSTANLIYKKLKDSGHQVYAVNPNAQRIDDEPCYPDVKSTPTRADAVMIVTTPQVTEQIVRDCVDAGISRVWMHCSFLHGVRSTSDAAVEFCKSHQISVIPMGCPMMFEEPVDGGHKFIRWWMGIRGNLKV
jgi:uncharacterized protein